MSFFLYSKHQLKPKLDEDEKQNKVSSMMMIMHGRRWLRFEVPPFNPEGLTFSCSYGPIVPLQPLGEDKVTFLTDIVNFVMTQVPNKQYKPFWLNRSLFVNVCKCFSSLSLTARVCEFLLHMI